MSRRRPILGERPPTVALTCCWCGRLLKPNFKTTSEVHPTSDGYETKEHYVGGLYGYGYASNNLFCTRGHGYLYGIRAAQERSG